MECVVLGNGGMMPMPGRLTTSVLVRRNGRMLMCDAGEGIQLALKRGGLGILGLDAVLISHLHADHVLGLPGIMMFRAQNERPGPLTLIGPPGLGRFVHGTIQSLGCYINYPYDIIEWPEHQITKSWKWGDVQVSAEILDHSVYCLGYRLDEPMRPGRFDTERAAALGISAGPLFGRLQAGESVETSAGAIIRPEQVLGPSRRGRSLAYATDTRPCHGLSALLQHADMAFVEGMFSSAHQAEALQKKHMTGVEAARSAAVASVDRLILVHLSPRYSQADEAGLAAEARTCFANAEISRALATYPIPLPD